jgi:hypothetical protein
LDGRADRSSGHKRYATHKPQSARYVCQRTDNRGDFDFTDSGSDRNDTAALPREKVGRFVAAIEALLEDMPKTSRDVALGQLLEESADTFKKPPRGSGSTKQTEGSRAVGR